jgi:hypothetical protein
MYIQWCITLSWEGQSPIGVKAGVIFSHLEFLGLLFQFWLEKPKELC